MKKGGSEYAQAVDYRKIEPFKRVMIEACRQTLKFPNRRDVFVDESLIHSHGGVYEYQGGLPHLWCKTTEGLGNKNWIAEWMYENAGTGKTYYEYVMWDTILMAVNDLIAQGAMPAIYTDEVAAGDSDWFTDEKRSQALTVGMLELCFQDGIAVVAGESPSLVYLVKAEPPVKSAPSFSGCITGIIAPTRRLITGEKLCPGDHILGAPSTGIHANGISLVIKRAMSLPDKFLTLLPDGKTLGEHALIPTRSYVALIEHMQKAGVEIHALLPGTGSGVAKIAFDHRPFTYRISKWVDNIPQLFLFMRYLGVSLQDCLTTFNWGIGYYLFVPENEVEVAIYVGKQYGYDLIDLGRVEEGERKVIFEPEGIILPPPGD